MLKPGTYRAEHITFPDEYPERFDWCEDYEIEMKVKETPKSFILTLESFITKCAAPQIEDMFRDKKRVTIKKDGSIHVMCIWNGDNSSFTLYPYRAGIPYAFRLMGEGIDKTVRA